MNNIKLLRLAKELTESCDIKKLISYAEDIKKYINNDIIYNSIYDHTKLKFSIKSLTTDKIINSELNELQKQYEEFYYNNNNMYLNTSKRQTGVSSFIAYIAVIEAISNFNKNILIISRNRNSSSEIMEKVKNILNNSDNITNIPGINTYNYSCVSFDNGSRIISKKCEGEYESSYSPNIILIDDFSYISYGILNKFLKSIYTNTNITDLKIIGFSTGVEDGIKPIEYTE